jgi:hypothetical protein
MMGMCPNSLVARSRPARPETEDPNSVPIGVLDAIRTADWVAGRAESTRPAATSDEAVAAAAVQASRFLKDLGRCRRDGPVL